MLASPRPSAPAFRRLERALLRRRFLLIEPRLRIELALLTLLIAGFLFWQVRVPLDGLVRLRGPLAGASVVTMVWLALAVLGAAMTAGGHARRLRTGPAGPEWLALPIEPAELERHLAWSAQSRLVWLAVPALGVLAAAAGLLPAWWLVLLAAACAGLLVLSGRVGSTIGRRVAQQSAEPRPGLSPIQRLLASRGASRARRRIAPARWVRSPAWRTLTVKDLLVTVRRPALLRSALLPLVIAAASLLAWALPGEPALRRFATFALALLAAAALAEWLVLLSGSDPFATLRVLPLSAGTVWGSRAVLGLAGAAALVVGQALVARGLAPSALQLYLAWVGCVTLAITILGVNYGVTLFPRADIAQRLLGLSLGLSVAASIMLPLSGWVVLLAAVLHSARRLPRWNQLEEA